MLGFRVWRSEATAATPLKSLVQSSVSMSSQNPNDLRLRKDVSHNLINASGVAPIRHMPMKSSKARAWHANCEQGFEESGSCTRQILQIALGSSFPAGVL